MNYKIKYKKKEVSNMVEKLFEIGTKEEFVKELKKSIFENRIDIEYILNVLSEYGVSLYEKIEEELEAYEYFEYEKRATDKNRFTFEKKESEKLTIIINGQPNSYNEITNIVIETTNKNKILEILGVFVRTCEEVYEEHNKGGKGLSDFFGEM